MGPFSASMPRGANYKRDPTERPALTNPDEKIFSEVRAAALKQTVAGQLFKESISDAKASIRQKRDKEYDEPAEASDGEEDYTFWRKKLKRGKKGKKKNGNPSPRQDLGDAAVGVGLVADYNSDGSESGKEGPIDTGLNDKKPVSWEMVGNTGWQRVIQGNGQCYYYNHNAKQSCWELPADVPAEELFEIPDEEEPDSTVEIPSSAGQEDTTTECDRTAQNSSTLRKAFPEGSPRGRQGNGVPWTAKCWPHSCERNTSR